MSSGVLAAVEAVGSSDVRTSSVYCLSHLDEVGLETQDPPLAAKEAPNFRVLTYHSS